MQVDRSWESAIREGSALWNRIVVSRKWEMEGGGVVGEKRAANEMLPWVLNFATDVTFANTMTSVQNHILSVVGMENLRLRFLSIPPRSVDAALLSLLLSKCPQLESLSVGGDLINDHGIQIAHSKLQNLYLFKPSHLKPITHRPLPQSHATLDTQ